MTLSAGLEGLSWQGLCCLSYLISAVYYILRSSWNKMKWNSFFLHATAYYIIRPSWMALNNEGLWQALGTGVLACRFFSEWFFASAVGSCKEDHKPCHGECAVLRVGLLCCHFCWDLNGPWARLWFCWSLWWPGWDFLGRGRLCILDLEDVRLIISTVQCAHTGIVVEHGGKMNLKKKVWFLEVLNISFYFEVCVIKLQKVYKLVERGDVDHFSEIFD